MRELKVCVIHKQGEIERFVDTLEKANREIGEFPFNVVLKTQDNDEAVVSIVAMKKTEKIDLLITDEYDVLTLKFFRKIFPEIKIMTLLNEKRKHLYEEEDSSLSKPIRVKDIAEEINQLFSEEKKQIKKSDQQYKALADATRRKILDLLQEREYTVSELALICETTNPNISQHLKVLKESDLIEEEKRGLYVFYRVNEENLNEKKGEITKVINIKEKIIKNIQHIAEKENCEFVIGGISSQDVGVVYIIQGNKTVLSFTYSFRLTTFEVKFQEPIQLTYREWSIEYKDIAKTNQLYEVIEEELIDFNLEKSKGREKNKRIEKQFKNSLLDRAISMDVLLKNDKKTIQRMKKIADDMIKEDYKNMLSDQKEDLIEKAVTYVTTLDRIQQFLENPNVTKIMVNQNSGVWIERNGKNIKTDIEFEDKDEIGDIAKKIALKLKQKMGGMNIIKGMLWSGCEATIIFPPMSEGITISIEKFFNVKLTVEDLIIMNVLNEGMANFLEKSIKAKANILFVGTINSWKETVLNAFLDKISEEERIVFIEKNDSFNSRHENIVKLKPTSDKRAVNKVTINECIQTARILKPQRVIVDEIGNEEMNEFIEMCNTGFDGTLATMIAYNTEDALERIQKYMYLNERVATEKYNRDQIAKGVDIIVHMKTMNDGTKKVMSIEQINEYSEKSNRIEVRTTFAWKKADEFKEEKFERVNYILFNKLERKMEDAGLLKK